MSFITAITDRTQSDIDNLTSKAFFNVVDWLRIDNNVVYIKTLIAVLQSVNVDYNDLPEPTMATIPSVDDINQFVENIEALRIASNLPAASGAVALKTDYLSGPVSETPDFTDVNAWENNLLILYTYLIKTATYEVFCGVAEAGQERFWQNRFMTPFVPPLAPNLRRLRCGIAVCGRGLTMNNRFRRYT